MKKIVLLVALIMICSPVFAVTSENDGLFVSLESKDRFAKEISAMIGKAWGKWQDSVLIDNIKVDGSRGLLQAGDMGKPVFTSAEMMANFDRKDKTQEYIGCVRAVTKAVENGMRLWQRGYSNDNIPFPQGASCSFTLPPCQNVPVTLDSGRSTGDDMMAEDELYNFMLYHAPSRQEDVLVVLAASAKAISGCFTKWKSSCSIIGITASGGIAPHPSPMGTGPGPVRGAKGNNGKLIGPYFNGYLMCDMMKGYFREQMPQSKE